MPLRLNSLKTRTAVAIASVIAVILVANAVYLILTKRGELRRQTEGQAMTVLDGIEWLGHRGSVGRPVTGEMVVLDSAGERLPPG